MRGKWIAPSFMRKSVPESDAETCQISSSLLVDNALSCCCRIGVIELGEVKLRCHHVAHISCSKWWVGGAPSFVALKIKPTHPPLTFSEPHPKPG